MQIKAIAKQLGAITLGLGAAFSLAAKADNYDETVVRMSAEGLPSAVVSYADLDLNSAVGQAELDERISRAANLVCGQNDLRRSGSQALSLREAQAFRDCREEALSEAFADVHSSGLAVAGQ